MTIISNHLLFNTEGPIFMGASRNTLNCKVGIIGVPYDGTSSFRPGSRFGPNAIKEVSNSLETFCPQLNLDLNEINFADLGSLEIPLGAPEPVIDIVQYATKSICNKGIKPLIIGGEHSITKGAIQAIVKKHNDIILLQLDAHADLREEWLGSKNSHACAMRRCLDVIPSKNLFQLGIRSGTRKEFNELRNEKRLIPHKQGEAAVYLEQVLNPLLGKPIYISIDLDWFDPSILPGTGTPEPGGYFWEDFAAVIDVLKHHDIIGADVVELSPQLDTSGISSILAAKVTRSLILLLSQSSRIKG